MVVFHWKYNNYEKDAKSSDPSTLQKLSISLGNMKILKISRSNQKKGSPRMLIFTDVVWRKSDVDAPRQKKEVQECLYLPSFLKDVDDNNGWRKMTHFQNVNISKDVWQKWATHGSGQGCRTFQSGLVRVPQQHSEKCRIEILNGTRDVWQKWGSSARGQTNIPWWINKIYS